MYQQLEIRNGTLLQKLFWPTVRKKICSSDREKNLKFEADGREFAKIFRATFFSHSRSIQFFNRMLAPRGISDLGN